MKSLMKNFTLLILSIFSFSGCYTKLIIYDDEVREYSREYYEDENESDDADTVKNSTNTTIINNYYGDDYNRHSRYKYSFRYYYPRRYNHWSDWYFENNWYDDCWYPCNNYNFYAYNYGYNPWWYYPNYYPYYGYYNPYYNNYNPYYGYDYRSGNLNNAVYRTRTGSGETRGEDDNTRTRYGGSNPSPNIGSGTGTIIGSGNASTNTTNENKIRERSPWWERTGETPKNPEGKKRTIIGDENSGEKKKNRDAVNVPEKTRTETPSYTPREKKRENNSSTSNPPRQSNPPTETRTREKSDDNNSDNPPTRKRDN